MSKFPDVLNAEPIEPLEITPNEQPAEEWEVATYKRILMAIGDQRDDQEFQRARTLLQEFNHFFPDAKAMWDAYCTRMGVA